MLTLNINTGDIIIKRILHEESDNSFVYEEYKYIVLTVDNTCKEIRALYWSKWITGYHRDLAYDFDDLLFDGYIINTFFRNGIDETEWNI